MKKVLIIYIATFILLSFIATDDPFASSRGGQQGYDDMVFVKGGCFNMGDTFGDGGAVEKPEHEVCVDDFHIGKYEVTQGQWKTVMGSNPSHFSSCGDNCPVESISWNDAKEYIRKLNRQTGKNFRLPTFTEWVYAARSGGKREKWAGTSSESELGEYAWYKDNSGNKTHAVGQKKSNGLGIYDMSGNVWEWVSDWYNYKNSSENNSNRTNSVSYYVLRGGAWNYNQKMLRGRLVGFSPDFQIISSGLRIASTPRRNSGEMSREITVVPEEIKNMVFVKGGCFEMGCGDWTRVCDDDEKPVHKVCLDDYYIDMYEVTQKEYRRVIGENPSSTFENTLMASKPVDSVTWHDAKAYCEKVTKRLPTEAEWEYAARSGGKRQKFAGFSDYSEMFYYVNHCDKNCFFTANKTDQNDGYKRTAPVGSYKANELGIYDMSGNVWEWVSDWHKADYYKHSSMHNPQGPETGSERVLRGGSWSSYPKAVRSSYRNRKVPFNTNVDNGFRCARTP